MEEITLSLSEAYDLVAGKIETWLETGVIMLPNLLVAILVVILFFIIANFAKKMTLKLVNKVSDNRTVNGLFGAIIRIVVLIAGFFVALSLLELDKTVSTFLAGAGIIGLALGFAFQNIATNFMSGIIISIRKPIRIGDFIESIDKKGTVQAINLRTTLLKTVHGNHVYLPNKEILENPITNYTNVKEQRVDISVGVSYADDLQKAEDLAIKAVETLDCLKPDREIDLYYMSFGDSSINFTVRFWVDFSVQTDYLQAQSKAIKAIKKSYDENGITIPFPIRTLDFDIKGGENLKTMLNEKNKNENK